MTYVAQELEQPYGDDPNDLPLYAMQTSLNDSLVTLLSPEVQKAPVLKFDLTRSSLECKLWSTDADPNARLKQKHCKIKQYAVPTVTTPDISPEIRPTRFSGAGDEDKRDLTKRSSVGIGASTGMQMSSS